MRSRVRVWSRRIAWLLALWLASIGLLAIVAYLLRWIMTLAGMTV